MLQFLRTLIRFLTMATAYAATTAGVVSLAVGPGPRLDWSRPLEWLQSHAPEDAVGAGLRLAAVAVGSWFLVSVTLAAVAHLVGWRPSRVFGLLTPRFVRGLVDGLLAAVVTTGAMAPLPASARPASPAPAASTQVRTGRAGDLGTRQPDPTPLLLLRSVLSGARLALPGAPADAPRPDAATSPTWSQEVARETRPRSHVIAPGEHLWAIAATEVATTRGRAVDTLAASDIEPYWRAVCEANRGHLGSGDVNLIYPGEIVELPAA